MRDQMAKLRRNNNALLAGTVVLAVFIMAPAALSQQVIAKQGAARAGVIFQVAAPEVTIAATDNTASEPGANTGAFTISRTGANANPLTVNFSISGTADNGSDYASMGGTVVIPATKTSVVLGIKPFDDMSHEDGEGVTITVTAGDAYIIGSPAAATVTITDNDLPSVSVTAVDGAASETGPDPGSFTITRTGSTTASLTVAYKLTGTATNGTDYSSLATTVVIPAGQTSASLTVTPTNDGGAESAETVILTITANAQYTVGSPPAANVTLSDDDLPSVSVTAPDAAASETSANPGKFTVSRTGPTTGALTVAYTLSGNAINGTDYTTLASAVVIPAGQKSTSITVTPTNDGVAESAETAILTLMANPLYSVGSPAVATVTISDGGLPSVTIAATDDSAAEAGSATGTFTVTRTGDLNTAMTVNYTVGGSATNGSDYTSLSGSVVIAAGANSAIVVVAPVDDAIDETNENVVVTLASGAGYQIGSSNDDNITIADNDGTTPNPNPNPNPNPEDKPKPKDQCKDGGWRTFGHFKNQGDCVSWFATDGKNKPAG